MSKNVPEYHKLYDQRCGNILEGYDSPSQTWLVSYAVDEQEAVE